MKTLRSQLFNKIKLRKFLLKSKRFWSFQVFTLLAAFGLMLGEFSSREANAARFDVLPGFKINGLGNFRGQYLHLIYAIGAKPILSSENDSINLQKIRKQVSLNIQFDQETLGSITLEKEGIQPSYNFVVAVISKNPDFLWINANGSVPQGAVGSSSDYQKIKIISRSEIESIVRSQSEPPSAVFINLNILGENY